MAKVEPAKRHRSDAQWAAPIPAPRPRLTAIAGDRSGERTAAHAVPDVRAVGWWLVVLVAGLAVWTGVFYGLLSRLTGSF